MPTADRDVMTPSPRHVVDAHRRRDPSAAPEKSDQESAKTSVANIRRNKKGGSIEPPSS
jgi:hypothetical protein